MGATRTNGLPDLRTDVNSGQQRARGRAGRGASADLGAAAGGEERVAGPAGLACFIQAARTAAVCLRSGVLRFYGLPGAVQVSPGAQLDVGVDPQVGTDGHVQQGVVAPAGPGVPVRGQQGRVCRADGPRWLTTGAACCQEAKRPAPIRPVDSTDAQVAAFR